MKKVLILASVASMIDQFNMQNIEILQSMGYEVHVAANFKQGSTSSEERLKEFQEELKEANIIYHHLDFSRNIMNILANLKAYKQIRKLIIKNNYKFIHCHSPIGGVCGRLAAKITKTKVIYTAHGFHFFKGAPKINWLIYYPIEKCLSYITDTLITINKEDYCIAKKKMKAQKIEYIPGIGIDINRFENLKLDKNKKRKELNIPEDAIVILSVGELNKNKNHEIIIKSISKLNSDNLYYCIAGQGNLDSYLMELCESLNISDKVRLLGFRKDIDEIYKCSDLFCFPSYREGLSVSLMEVMASGLPVICSKIRGNTDLIKNENGGYLCNPNNEDEFINAIDELVKSKELRDKLGNYNKEFIKDFDIKVVKDRMELIYNSI